MPAKVLVASDLGCEADEAIRQGHLWASETDASLVLCTVLPEGEAPESSEQAAEALVDRAGGVIGEPSRTLSARILHGSPSVEILGLAEQEGVDLIVLGLKQRAGFWHKRSDGVVDQVVRRAPCSVLVARPSPASAIVLAATDLSDPALPALRAGAEHALRGKAQLAALHCYAPLAALSPVSSFDVPPIQPDAGREHCRNRASAALETALSEVGVIAKAIVDEGPATSQILRTASRLDAELIVVGTVGRTGLARLVLGNVAEVIARSAPCSTLVVRLDPRRRGRSAR